MKNELWKTRNTVWAVAFFLVATYLLYHGEYFLGIINVVGMLFHEVLSLIDIEEKG